MLRLRVVIPCITLCLLSIGSACSVESAKAFQGESSVPAPGNRGCCGGDNRFALNNLIYKWNAPMVIGSWSYGQFFGKRNLLRTACKATKGNSCVFPEVVWDGDFPSRGLGKASNQCSSKSDRCRVFNWTKEQARSLAITNQWPVGKGGAGSYTGPGYTHLTQVPATPVGGASYSNLHTAYPSLYASKDFAFPTLMNNKWSVFGRSDQGQPVIGMFRMWRSCIPGKGKACKSGPIFVRMPRGERGSVRGDLLRDTAKSYFRRDGYTSYEALNKFKGAGGVDGGKRSWVAGHLYGICGANSPSSGSKSVGPKNINKELSRACSSGSGGIIGTAKKNSPRTIRKGDFFQRYCYTGGLKPVSWSESSLISQFQLKYARSKSLTESQKTAMQNWARGSKRNSWPPAISKTAACQNFSEWIALKWKLPNIVHGSGEKATISFEVNPIPGHVYLAQTAFADPRETLIQQKVQLYGARADGENIVTSSNECRNAQKGLARMTGARVPPGPDVYWVKTTIKDGKTVIEGNTPNKPHALTKAICVARADTSEDPRVMDHISGPVSILPKSQITGIKTEDKNSDIAITLSQQALEDAQEDSDLSGSGLVSSAWLPRALQYSIYNPKDAGNADPSKSYKDNHDLSLGAADIKDDSKIRPINNLVDSSPQANWDTLMKELFQSGEVLAEKKNWMQGFLPLQPYALLAPGDTSTPVGNTLYNAFSPVNNGILDSSGYGSRLFVKVQNPTFSVSNTDRLKMGKLQKSYVESLDASANEDPVGDDTGQNSDPGTTDSDQCQDTPDGCETSSGDPAAAQLDATDPGQSEPEGSDQAASSPGGSDQPAAPSGENTLSQPVLTDFPATIVGGAQPGEGRVFEFEFEGEDGSSFECKLDSEAWAGCESPKKYLDIREGSHIFQVRSLQGDLSSLPVSHTWEYKQGLSAAEREAALRSLQTKVDLKTKETRMFDIIGESRFSSGSSFQLVCGAQLFDKNKKQTIWSNQCTSSQVSPGPKTIRITSDTCAPGVGQLPLIQVGTGRKEQCSDDKPDLGLNADLGNNLRVRDAYQVPSLPAKTQTELLGYFTQGKNGPASFKFDFDSPSLSGIRSMVSKVQIWKLSDYLDSFSSGSSSSNTPFASYVLGTSDLLGIQGCAPACVDNFQFGINPGSSLKMYKPKDNCPPGSSTCRNGVTPSSTVASQLPRGDYVVVIGLLNPSQSPSASISRWGLTATIQEPPGQEWINRFGLKTTASQTAVFQSRAAG